MRKILLFVLISILCFTLIDLKAIKGINVMRITKEDDIEELQKENVRLKGVLASLVPREQKIIYENSYRTYGNWKPTFQVTSLRKVVEEGKNINFNVLYKNEKYLRPIYDSSWQDFYFRGWIYLPSKIEDARHRLFIFPFGGSSIFDFSGSLSLDLKTSIDYHREINFLIYDFNVEEIRELDNQIALIGEPKRHGIQVVSVIQNDLLSKNTDTKEFLVQLSTPKGYEIDFIYENVIRYEYLKKQIEENTVKPSFSDIDRDKEQLKNENALLREELSNYIPLEKGIIKKDICERRFEYKEIYDIKTVREKGRELAFQVKYHVPQYRRPIFHPSWRQNYRKGWNYIPQKICENLHTLYTIPKDSDKRTALLGNLGFYDVYQPINDDEVGFLVYYLTVQKVIQLNDQIIIIGIPTRTGVEIISLNQSYIPCDKDYTIQLVTPDNYEIDYLCLPF